MRDSSAWSALVVCTTLAGCGGSSIGGDPCGGEIDCVASVDASDPVCVGGSIRLTPRAPAVYLLLDRSGSMISDFGDNVTERWDGVAAAVAGPGGVVEALADRVSFGAAVYDNDEQGACPDLVHVTATLDNLAAIGQLVDDQEPRHGEGPTGEAIQALLGAIAAAPPPADAAKIIIVATDGEPDTCAVPNPQNGQPEAVAAAQGAFDAGFLLYMLSLGSGGDSAGPAYLQDMANAGVGLPLGGPAAADYFGADDTEALITALAALLQRARCAFVLGQAVDLDRVDEGTVVLASAELGFGTDWTMQGPSTLILLGDACDAMLASPDLELTFDLLCE